MKSRWLVPILLWFIVSAIYAQGKSMSSPKSECESLMNEALPLAKQMLSTDGEFFPYGAALSTAGKVVSVAAYDGRERPPSADVIRLLKQGFVQGAETGQYKATALVYDVRVISPSSGEKTDAIAVSLNHRDNYSVLVFLAYKIRDGKYVPGEVFAQKGESDVFK